MRRDINEAMERLEEAKLDYIISLLEDSIEIPSPKVHMSVTVGPPDTFVADAFGESDAAGDFTDTLQKVTRKVDREELYQVVAER